MRNHKYKVSIGTGWVSYENLTPAEREEADHKGLVEHDEWCWCVKNIGEPPF